MLHLIHGKVLLKPVAKNDQFLPLVDIPRPYKNPELSGSGRDFHL
jgi:hypothetical protein